MQFVLGHRSFRSKDAARAEIRRILHSAEIDKPLTDGDASLIAALYDRHPRKTGVPARFCVGINNYHGSATRGFHAFHPDGGREAFSYLPCLSPQVDEPNLIKTMRAVIMASQREAMRNAYAGRAFLPCNDCKKPVPLAEAQVHHLPPKFRDIADAFIALVGAPVVVNGELGDDFADYGIARRWTLFHDAVAHRVVVCARCNAAAER